jgi:IS5 family transposase
MLALKFRHLLEKHGAREKILEAVNEILEEKGIMMRGGTIIDATFVEAPSSTKNKEKSRDPETRSAKKGNTCILKRSAHIRVDAASGMVHSVAATAAAGCLYLGRLPNYRAASSTGPARVAH